MKDPTAIYLPPPVNTSFMDSEPQSPRSPASPDKSLQQLLPTRSKKNGKVSPSRLSIASSDASDRLGMRTSISDKLKDIRRGSSDSDRRSSADSGKRKRLSRLVKRRSRSRSKHTSKSPLRQEKIDAGPGLGLLDEDNSKLNINSLNASTESFSRPNKNKSRGSRILTEDSETEP